MKPNWANLLGGSVVFVEAMVAMCKSRLKKPDRTRKEKGEWERVSVSPPVLRLQGQVDFAGFTNEDPR